MNLQDLGSLGELVAGLATIVTLVYLATQIRQNTQVVKTTNYMNLSSQVNEFAKSIAQDGALNDLYLRGAECYTDLSAAEQSRLNMLLSMLIHPYQSMYMVKQRGHVDESMMSKDFDVMTTMFQQPGITQWWEQNQHWWQTEFRDFLNTKMSGVAINGDK